MTDRQLDQLVALVDRLSPLLPGLTRHDVHVAPVDGDGTEGEVEFVFTPIGWTKISLSVGMPAGGMAGKAWAFVRCSFLPLYCPVSDADRVSVSPPRRGATRTFYWLLPWLGHRWMLDRFRIDETARDIALAADLRWRSAILQFGTAEAYAHEYRYEAIQDPGWLETLSYARILAGDLKGARFELERLKKYQDLGAAAASRAEEVDRLLQSEPNEAREVLDRWRLERLQLEGLLEFAASRAEADAFEVSPVERFSSGRNLR